MSRILISLSLLALFFAAGLSAQTQSFAYDSEGRLIETTAGQGSLDYDYDAEGNITGSLQDGDSDTLGDEFETVIIDALPDDDFENFADVTPEQDFDGDGTTNGEEFAALSFPADNVVPAVGLTGLLILTAALLGFHRWQQRRQAGA